jgi:hypothetical protein
VSGYCTEPAASDDDGVRASALEGAQLIERIGEASERASFVLVRHKHIDQWQERF